MLYCYRWFYSAVVLKLSFNYTQKLFLNDISNNFFNFANFSKISTESNLSSYFSILFSSVDYCQWWLYHRRTERRQCIVIVKFIFLFSTRIFAWLYSVVWQSRIEFCIPHFLRCGSRFIIPTDTRGTSPTRVGSISSKQLHCRRF